MHMTTSLPKEVVETQLARIIGSRQFCNAPRLSRFLVFVVEESLAGRRDRLKGYTIGMEVFDRPESFDPQSDTIVRVQARALRQKLDEYYAQDGRDDPIHITIAKGSYEPSFVFALDGDPPANVETTPPPAMTGKPSIAVLPFDDFSRNKSNAFFALGITEATIASLSRFRELSVFSRSTTEKLKRDNLGATGIREIIGADFLLEGSVRIDERQVDITISLVDASADTVILTDHFQRKSTPEALYEIQDDMARRIASRIANRFGPLAQFAGRSSMSGQARKWKTFYWISRYHQYAVQLSPEDRQDIRQGLQAALETDPGSSEAYAVLSLITADDYRLSISGESEDGILERMLEQAQAAVTRDPENAIAHEALATARFHRGEFPGFDRAAKQALRLNPGHGDMLARLALCYGARGNWAEALPLLERALALNPLHPSWYHVVRAIGYAMTRGVEDAAREMRAFPLPGNVFYHSHLLWVLVELGDAEAAMQEKARVLELLPDFERVMTRHLRVWYADPRITERAFAAWRKVGLIER